MESRRSGVRVAHLRRLCGVRRDARCAVSSFSGGARCNSGGVAAGGVLHRMARCLRFSLNSEIERCWTSLNPDFEAALGELESGCDDYFQLRRSWDLPVQDVVQQRDPCLEATPAFRQVKHQATAGSAENGTTGEDLSPDRGRLAIDRKSSRALELGQQVEQQQHGAEGGFGSKELFQAETVGAQIMLQLGDAVFHVSAPVVASPDLLRSVGATGDEDAEGVARHVDQLAAHAVAALPDALAQDHESSLDIPTVQPESKFSRSVVVIQDGPLLHSLGGALDPRSQPSHYNVGQQALFQKAQQLVVEEA